MCNKPVQLGPIPYRGDDCYCGSDSWGGSDSRTCYCWVVSWRRGRQHTTHDTRRRIVTRNTASIHGYAGILYTETKQHSMILLTYRFNTELIETKSLNNLLSINQYFDYNNFKWNKFNYFFKSINHTNSFFIANFLYKNILSVIRDLDVLVDVFKHVVAEWLLTVRSEKVESLSTWAVYSATTSPFVFVAHLIYRSWLYLIGLTLANLHSVLIILYTIAQSLILYSYCWTARKLIGPSVPIKI